MKKTIILCIASLLISANTIAQRDNIPALGGEGEKNNNEGGTGIVRVEDTLQTYIKIWHLGSNNLPVELEIDTFLTFFHHYNPIYKNSFKQLSLNTGNIGSPNLKLTNKSYFTAHSHLYYHKLQPSIYDAKPFLFIKNMTPYMYDAYNGKFYHTNKPYTNIKYHMNGSVAEEEQSLYFTHTQNVNKSLNIGINYKLFNSIGTYSNQKNANNSIRLFSSFIGRMYMAHTAFSINKMKNYENCGIQPDADLDERTNAILVNNEEALTTYSNNNLLLVQRLNFGKKIYHKPAMHVSDSLAMDSININQPDSTKLLNRITNDSIPANNLDALSIQQFQKTDSIKKDSSLTFDFIMKHSIVHRFEYATNSHYYIDDNANNGFYHHIFNTDSTQTRDSVYCRTFRNTIEWQLPVNTQRKILPLLGLRFLATNNVNYYYNQKHFILKQNDTVTVDNYVGAQLFKDKGKFLRFDFSSKYYVSGYRIGDYSLRGEMKQFIKGKNDSSVVAVAATIESETPSVMWQKYYSNHLRWNNNFDDKLSIHINGAFTKPTWHLTVGGGMQLLHNHIYIGTDTLPHQTNNAVEGIYGFVNKDFHLGHFRSHNKVIYQHFSDKTVFHLPNLALMSSNYFEFLLFKKVLQIQIGAELTYTTTHYAPAYMPALGLYYLQDDFKTGNYPMVDVFLNAKLKGVFIFLKFEHVNTAITEEKYFQLTNYPTTDMMFRFGLFWRFFN